MSDSLKRKAAEAALGELSPGMAIGLGTGSTARHFISMLGDKVARGFACLGVPTSEESAQLARKAGIRLTTLEQHPQLDIAVDGADEISPDLGLIKGGGGALFREKIVACSAERMIVIADASKMVPTLGKFPLPIEVDAFALSYVRPAVASIMKADGASGEIRLRQAAGGKPFLTDGGHLILDAFFGRISDTKTVGAALKAVPGVIEHGLFLGLCSVAYVGAEGGVDIVRADVPRRHIH